MCEGRAQKRKKIVEMRDRELRNSGAKADLLEIKKNKKNLKNIRKL